MSLHEYRSRDGVIVYTKRGLGDPLLLVHGIYPGASHHEFDLNAAAWQGRFTVYAVDLLGFGQSDAPRRAHSAQMHQHLLRDLLKEVIAAPAAVVGSGDSAGIAARLGVYDDAWITKLVLLAPPNKPVYHEPPGLGDRFSQFLLGTLAVGTGHYTNAASRDGLREFLRESYHDRRAITPQIVDQMFVEANEPNKMMPYISSLCGYFDTDLANWLPYVRRPTQIVVGRDQLPVPQEKWLKPAQWSMGKRLDVVDDTRDFPHQERSAAVNELVLKFLTNTG
ncbi:MAG TPA: alpha/beta hydrolase [Tepidisphaeraceae bacterium]|jgi:pimeloyl-ACP methyl ester carboxylesterase